MPVVLVRADEIGSFVLRRFHDFTSGLVAVPWHADSHKYKNIWFLVDISE
ncbi:hypothetical protein QTP88_002852 [Uroleucon formosanum]